MRFNYQQRVGRRAEPRFSLRNWCRGAATMTTISEPTHHVRSPPQPYVISASAILERVLPKEVLRQAFLIYNFHSQARQRSRRIREATAWISAPAQPPQGRCGATIRRLVALDAIIQRKLRILGTGYSRPVSLASSARPACSVCAKSTHHDVTNAAVDPTHSRALSERSQHGNPPCRFHPLRICFTRPDRISCLLMHDRSRLGYCISNSLRFRKSQDV